ncbi:MAG TPA: toll/interleukin-1 receptor domain-containing protein [Allosphingosinicella sp.]|nr:toll/interleukin-1 receptor domain-containing protein [Allosphingosinicella sp.]
MAEAAAAPAPPSSPAHGFISYSHEDYRLFRRLKRHLKPLETLLKISFWADERIEAGERWNDSIARAIADASMHLLLFTPDFCASDYIFEIELPAIQRKYAAGDLVLPVVARRCMWQPFVSALQAVPSRGGRLLPICEWKPQDSGLDAARDQLARAICGHLGKPIPPAFDWSRP